MKAPYMYDRQVTDDEYCQAVRRFRPSSLLPLVAAAGAEYGVPADPPVWLTRGHKKFTPWALADVARVATTRGTEFQRADATGDDLLRILCAHSSLMDPTLHKQEEPDMVRLRDFLLRTAGEQMPYQGAAGQNLARTAAMYLQTPFPTRRTPRFLTPGWDDGVFGCSLTDYVAVAQLLWVGSLLSKGRFDLALADRADMQPIRSGVPLNVIEQVLREHFTIDSAGMRQAEAETMVRLKGRERGPWRRFSFNPLLGKPALAGFSDGLLVPVPQLVWRKATPEGIYHSGMASLGSGFAEETGYLFEEYVGRQLRLLQDAEVIPEIPYKDGKQKVHSVDWFVVFDDLVLLVEVKSMMPTEPARLGVQEGVDATMRKLEHAVGQIQRSHQAISDRNPAFSQIPTDRPCQGLVVTLESFPIANSGFPDLKFAQASIPVTVVSAAEVEHLVCLADIAPNELLAERARHADQVTWSLDAVLANHMVNPNAVLNQAWFSYPWAQSMEAAFAAASSDPTARTVPGPTQETPAS